MKKENKKPSADLSTAMDNLFPYLINYNSDGTILYASENLLSDFYKNENIVGRNINDALAVTHANRDWHIGSDVKIKNSEPIEFDIICKPQTDSDYELKFKVIGHHTGNSNMLFTCICHETLNTIETIKNYKSSNQGLIDREARLTMVLDNIPSYIILYNEKFEIENINSAGEIAANLPITKIRQSRGFEAFGCVNAMSNKDGCGYSEICKECKYRNQVFKSFKTDTPQLNKSIKLRTSYNDEIKTKHFNVSSIPLTILGEKKVMVKIDDNSERIKIESNLLEAKTKAEESDNLKAAFLATMSHELRTPLNTVIGFSELIEELDSVEEIKEMTKLINKSGTHLSKIVSEILEISNLQGKELKINKEYFRLSPLYSELKIIALDEINAASKTNITVQITGEKNVNSLVYSDQIKLKKIFIQLIRNAITFTKEGSIEFGHHIDEEGKVIFYVKDTGIGIDTDNHEKLFKEFIQIEEYMTRENGGLGIGLSIAKRLVQSLGGQIWLKSDKGIGSAFYFKLNCLVDSKAKQTSKKSFPNLNGKRILVAEDNDSNFNFLKIVLNRANLNFIRAKNGKEAVDLIKEHSDILLVLMDTEMPIMDGIEATKQIKGINPSITIIAQTAYALAGDRRKCEQAGCDDFIAKPYSVSKMLNKIQQYLELGETDIKTD